MRSTRLRSRKAAAAAVVAALAVGVPALAQGQPRVSPSAVAAMSPALRACALPGIGAVRGLNAGVCTGLQDVDPGSAIGARAAAPRVLTPGSPPPCVTQAGINDRCEQWAQRFSDPARYSGTLQNSPLAMVASPRGDVVYIVGTTRVDGSPEISVAAFTASTGSMRWVTHAPSNPPTGAAGIAISPDGSTVYVTGTEAIRVSLTTNPYLEFYTIALATKTGRELWVARSAGEGQQYNGATSIATSRRGDVVYVGGFAQEPGSYQRPPIDYAVIAYRARTGRILWQSFYAGEGGQNFVYAVHASPAGDRVFATGDSERKTSSPTIPYDVATVALSAHTGRRLWASRYAGGGGQDFNFAFALAVDPHARQVAVAGATEYDASSSTFKYLTLGYSAASGRRAWTATYLGVSGGNDVANALASSPKGDAFYVTGESVQLQNLTSNGTVNGEVGRQTAPNAVTIAYTLTGKRLWLASYAPQPDISSGTALSVSSTGTIYIGALLATPPFTLGWPAVVAYDAHGHEKWVARYDVRDLGALSPPLLAATGPVAILTDPKGKWVDELSVYSPATSVDGAQCTVNSTLGNTCPSPPSSYDLITSYRP